jgi:hypothetical protein
MSVIPTTGQWDASFAQLKRYRVDLEFRIQNAIGRKGRQMTQDKLSEELVALDTALCQFLNSVGDRFDPIAEWSAEVSRAFSDVSAAYDKCHSAGILSVAAWNARALRSATPMPGVKPVAYLINDPMAGEPEVSFIKTLGVESIPLYATPPAREVSEAEVERAWQAYDAKAGYSKPERMRAALEAARSPS